MGIVRTAAWLSAALAVGFPHVTLAGDAGPGKEVRALRHDAPGILSGRLNGATVTIDNVRVDDGHAAVQWHTASSSGTDVFKNYYGAWVDVERDGLPNDPLVHVTMTPALAPFTITARMPTYAESWANVMLGGYGNSYSYFDLDFTNDAPVAFPNGTRVQVWIPFVLDESLKYELTFAYPKTPLEPVYAKASGTTLTFSFPGFTIPAHAHLICEVDAIPDR